MRKNIFNIITLCLLSVSRVCGDPAYIHDRCFLADNIAANSIFSDLCDVTRASDGTYEVRVPEKIKEIDGYHVYRENMLRLSFSFLCFVFKKTFENGYSRQRVIDFLNIAFKSPPFNSVVRGYFDIDGIEVGRNCIILRFKKFKGIFVKFFPKSTSPEERYASSGNGTIKFEIITENNEKIDDGIDKDRIVHSLFTVRNGGEKKRAFSAFKREREEFSRRIINGLLKKGGELCHFLVDISGGFNDISIVKESDKEMRGQIANGILSVPVIRFDGTERTGKYVHNTYQGRFDELFGKVIPENTAGSRRVYIGKEVILKTMHYNGFYGTDVQLRALTGEYAFQKKMLGGLFSPWPVALITLDGKKFWLIEQRGMEIKSTGNYRHGIADVVRKTGMLFRAFDDEGIIPDQQDVLLDDRSDRIFMCDVYPHAFKCKRHMREEGLSFLKRDVYNGAFPEEAVKWFNEGFDLPEQFGQYRAMKEEMYKEKENSVKRFLNDVEKRLSPVFDKIFSRALWGSMSDFLESSIRPVALAQIDLSGVTRLLSAPARSKSIILSAEALDGMLAYDLEMSLKKIKRIIKMGNIVIYINRKEDEKKADKYTNIIQRILPHTNISMVKKKELPVGPGYSKKNGLSEADAIIRYVIRKDNDGNGMPEISEKDILGILITDDGMNLLGEMDDYKQKVPCILMNRRENGLFSFAQALEYMLDMYSNYTGGRHDAKNWIRILAPVKIYTGKMVEEFRRYKEYVLDMA